MLNTNKKYSIMTAGIKSSGKTAFLNTLMKKRIIKDDSDGIGIYKLNLNYDDKISRQIQFVDTPGFDSKEDFHIMETIADYIKFQYIDQIEEESKIKRNPNTDDNRIHLLLYFISATGFGLKQKDIVFLKKVDNLVNILPVISRADALTKDEKLKMRKLIREQLAENEIKIFNLEMLDFSTNGLSSSEISVLMPFTTYSSPNILPEEEMEGESTQEILNSTDFFLLENIILSSCADAFINYTENQIYETFRTNYLENKAMKKK